ncbi:MAG: MnhB domain-containing protein [Candidatus Aenigmarchaeota archaeon]|nr:MnhB domain-containing protein [Candidatus Aenigmarchaeota archaeon]
MLEKPTSKLLIVLIIIFGLNITIFGHLTPGGGFQGGAIIATSLALIFIVIGLKLWGERAINIVRAFGGFGIAFLIFFGLIFRPFFVESQELFRAWSGDYILFLNILCAVVVVSSLVLIVHAMVEKK